MLKSLIFSYFAEIKIIILRKNTKNSSFILRKSYIFALSIAMIMGLYIYQHENWTDFKWDEKKISPLLAEVRHLQGRLLGKMSSLGFDMQEEASLKNITLDVLKSSEIEGEKLNKAQVRSSIARRLGIEVGGLVSSARNIDGIVDMMLDATQNYDQPLTEERLLSWHGSLFPTGRSGLYAIQVAQYRTGEMQVVSGGFGREKVHYEAVLAQDVKAEMDHFLQWLNSKMKIDDVLKAAISHLWFVIIHPFDDGNGRIARAISDMLLARSDKNNQRFYSMSTQINKERKKYYEALEKTQRNNSDSDITLWLNWFLKCLKRAILSSEKILENILTKAEFWTQHAQTSLNERQILMLNKLLDGDFVGKLQSSKWAKICKCSQDTAIRDIKDLIEKGILQQEEGGGRSTNYQLRR
ncbi:MAG TPA: Fic family protein [Bacteroidales bacterium]|nr:Fic family protein [Bacteroidales bacterium]